jgi:hypothetical protein
LTICSMRTKIERGGLRINSLSPHGCETLLAR